MPASHLIALARWHTLSTHPLNTSSQHTLSTHPLNTSSQHTNYSTPFQHAPYSSLSRHTQSPPSWCPLEHTLSTHPLNPPYQYTRSTIPSQQSPLSLLHPYHYSHQLAMTTVQTSTAITTVLSNPRSFLPPYPFKHNCFRAPVTVGNSVMVGNTSSSIDSRVRSGGSGW